MYLSRFIGPERSQCLGQLAVMISLSPAFHTVHGTEIYSCARSRMLHGTDFAMLIFEAPGASFPLEILLNYAHIRLRDNMHGSSCRNPSSREDCTTAVFRVPDGGDGSQQGVAD